VSTDKYNSRGEHSRLQKVRGARAPLCHAPAGRGCSDISSAARQQHGRLPPALLQPDVVRPWRHTQAALRL